ncbi:bacteriocin [Streptomyces sp. SID5785]|uniref:family 1 encapsulin nanocompartment shell protein n=1 Tax=Streptomyces sp. SID5785 TaxID=2690309 RepID=UPI001361A7F0|nr:family 1 encapsulin nanocompartment shell protein [Streptomyces sp. SID5785]MZD04509.1 bacteriocin [Streptomyces sp. SID5785]
MSTNLHRDLAPITPAAWQQIEEEAGRTFQRHVAGRRVVDVTGPDGPELAAVGTGHLSDISPPAPGVLARLRGVQPLVDLRVPFTVGRDAVDDVERGAQDSDWQPVKDAARAMAFAEDRAIFDGYAAAGIAGLRDRTSNPVLSLPAEPRDYPDTISRALTALRLAGVDGPYSLLLGADAYTAVSETSDHGYPIAGHLSRILDGELIWAPALDGAYVLSTRGGDFELRLGQDLAIGYTAHDARGIELYFHQTLTFLPYTDEAVVALNA